MRSSVGAGLGDPAAAPVPRRRTALCVAGILAALLAWDLIYATHGEYRGVMSDAATYYQQSHELLQKAGHLLNRTEAADATYGPVPTVDGLIRWTVFRGIGYPAYLAAAQFVMGEGVAQARLANTVLHLGSALLVWRLAAMFGGPAVGLLGLLLFALYVPFTYMAAVLLTENLAAFLMLLAVWSGAAFFRARGGGRAAALAAVFGLSLILLPLARPGLALLSPVLLLTWVAAALWRGSREHARRLLAGAVVGVAFAAAPYLAWQYAVNSAFGFEHFTFATSGPRSVSHSLHESYDWETGGWPRPATFTAAPLDQLLEPPSAAESVRRAPLESALLRVEKFYRLWKAPATAYANPLWGGLGPVKGLHGAVVVGGLLGLLFFRPSPAWLLAALPVAYTAAVYTLYFSEERRFTLPVMGLLIVFAALAAAGAWRRLQRPERAPRRIWADLIWASGLLVAGAYVAADGFVPHPAVDARLAHWVMSVLFALSLAAGTWRVAHLMWGERSSRASLWRCAAAAGLLAVPAGVHLVHYADWYSWKVILRDPTQRLVQVFVPPSGLDWRNVRLAYLQIDARDRDGSLDNLEVRVNGLPQAQLVPARELPSTYRYMAEKLAPLARGVDWERVDVAPGMSQWLIYRLDPARLAGTEAIVASVRLTRKAETALETTEIGGELPTGNARIQRGPRPWLLPSDLKYMRNVPFRGRASRWRYQTYGDMRIHGGTRLIGTHRSAYVHGAGDETALGPREDLSPAPLWQTGSFRIRLQLITYNGGELFL